MTSNSGPGYDPNMYKRAKSSTGKSSWVAPAIGLAVGIVFALIALLHLISLPLSLIGGDSAGAMGHLIGLVLFGGLGVWFTIVGAKQLRTRSGAPAGPPQTPVGPQPGWYESPSHVGKLQWWDGGRWTEHLQDRPA